MKSDLPFPPPNPTTISSNGTSVPIPISVRLQLHSLPIPISVPTTLSTIHLSQVTQLSGPSSCCPLRPKSISPTSMYLISPSTPSPPARLTASHPNLHSRYEPSPSPQVKVYYQPHPDSLVKLNSTIIFPSPTPSSIPITY